ncbi:helix-turn-helix domain-containing protein [Streptomyces sp. TRM43335]|uniref:Helix-turn-helix domain-containing protein n=1 Tax=Streptomyces taklimakanensis TaxID=2569853 RepID=A0A6G2BGX9_9ACTN|nr:helix-turn-helix domain-containing protein [Streptomyces taklimakanensis]MTE21541.1 helix-turn-helix domain-containing protein [Streptomyces taklimakanensis]
MADSARPEHSIRTLDPRSLRALAHPLRIRILGALREYGPSTASRLAERLHESSGATSYHLRQLAAYDFVEEEPGRGTARERWWRAAQQGTQLGDVEEYVHHPDPEVRGALMLLMHEVATTHARELNTWLGTVHEWPEEWRQASDLSDFTLRLTPELAGELNQRLHELIESYRKRAVEGEEGTRFRVHLHAFPRTED